MATAERYLGSAVLLVALGLSPALGYATTFVLLGLAALTTLLLIAERFERAAHPSPTLPVEGRVPAGDIGTIQPSARSSTSPLTGEAGRGWAASWISPTTLFALAYALIAISALIPVRTPTDLLPLLGLTAPLFYGPLARLFALQGPLTRPAADLSPQGEVSVTHDLAQTPPLPRGRGRRAAAGEGAFSMLQKFALVGAFVGLATALLFRYGLGMPRAAEGFWLNDPYHLAVTTLLAATFALGAWFTPSRLRWPSLLALAAAIAVIALTGSRTALLGLPLLLLITGLCLARRPITRAGIVAATIAVAIAALFVELPGTERLRLWDVLAAIASGNPVADPAIDIRVGLARAATQLFASAPVFGFGWSEAAMSQVLPLLAPDQLSWGRIPHLHSDLGQFAVSGGLAGLAAYALLLIAPITGYLQLPREARTPQRLHALLVLVIGAIVLGLPDVFLAAPMTLTNYVVLAAAVVSQGTKS